MSGCVVGLWSRSDTARWCWSALIVCALLPAAQAQRESSQGRSSEAVLEAALKRFPDADANRDGKLSADEYRDYLRELRRKNIRVQRRSLSDLKLPDGARHESIMLPVRDGTGLATEVVLPAGEGPWPVLLFRTPYGRFSRLVVDGPRYARQGIATVTQDFRGLYDSEGVFDFFDHEIEDGTDTVNWVTDQTWCNGRVAMKGGSGPGIGAKLTMIGKPQGLVAVATSVAASNIHLYARYHGGVYRERMNDGWSSGQQLPVKPWPKPRTEPFDARLRSRTVAANAEGNQVAMLDVAGWYDIFLQSALDDFIALSSNPHNRLIIGGTGHGKLSGVKYPGNARAQSQSEAWLKHWLTGENPAVLKRPAVTYYLMGDPTDPTAPGNQWKQSDVWPVPHTPTRYYFAENHQLTTERPSDNSTLSYSYDPRDPVPTVGGANLFPPKGPMDQRALADREDILRFSTEPLHEPLEITGKVLVNLSISTDVPDTTFMAKLIDVYPGGTEALVLDSAVMARYWQGFDQPAPLKSGRTYDLTIDLWSTALVFNRGHRIAVHVTSSNSPRYEVHPNSFEPVHSFDGAPVATQVIHLGPDASHVVLPVIAPGQSRDYVPDSGGPD